MLEVQVKTSVLRVNGSFHLKSQNNRSFDLEMYSNRMFKRLIYNSSESQFGVDFFHAEEDFELVYFRLLRVSKKFARSRMLTKLNALHPNYKLKARKDHQKIDENKLGMATLWKHYCRLFEKDYELVSYSNWIRQYDTVSKADKIKMHQQAEIFQNRPLISIIMPVYNPNPRWLEQAIESVCAQIYPNWELCIADDSSTNSEIRLVLEKYSKADKRIKICFRKENGHISEASNSALAIATGAWIALLDHDDILPEHALFFVVDAINNNQDSQLIYSDEDKIDEDGKRSNPYFKCDWNQDLFYSQNMISHLGVYRADLVRKVGGFRKGLEGSQDYDLALRCIENIAPEQICHISRILYHWRIHVDSTAHDLNAKPYAVIAGEKALMEHFIRQGKSAVVNFVGNGYRTQYALPDILPLVSLIIPTKNHLELLKKCIKSILRKTSYTNYEIIIVDNGTDDFWTLRYLKHLSKKAYIKVIRDDQPFNYSALNNKAVAIAKGEIIGLINNDIEVITPDWLSEMVSHAIRPEIGVVGAKLLYADKTIQHAGVILGIEGFVGHAHRGLAYGSFGYGGRANLIQAFSAVTGACMVVKKSIYKSVGGLNEKELQIACNDIDFCLKVREIGYRNVWTPYAELYHHESSTRGFDHTPEKQKRADKEITFMRKRWGSVLKYDPAYNSNLSLDNEHFTLSSPPRVSSAYFLENRVCVSQ
ncbi:MAG: glycosyltransferase family 2 protein [Sulfurimonas sp.]|jgi:glycosyltransferase involved in cell wall biosynthesis